ncbi:MAG: vanadium-dependent haloperoxidase [Acidobacteria bacterium]|nr:vanadium-dependent haloperoxidase [Acidobacteriota bacterium]
MWDNNPNRFHTPRPDDSHPNGPKGRAAYQAQADEVLRASANLTDRQKMTAELFNDKIASLGFSAVFAALSRGLSLIQFIHLDFATNLAAFDTGIAVWNEKAKHDAVRPFSAIQYLYGRRPVRAWGGPGKGTVNDIPAVEWKEYLDVADHPEYPSGSAAFCAAHAQVARRFLGSDALNWSVPVSMGSSRVEPGITPSANIVLGPWPTWTAFETDCGLSRLWGGVHFRPAIEEGWKFGRPIGDLAFQFLKRHIDGNAPPLP